MKQSETSKWAYAAGFFDGEGCVRIARSNHKKNRKSPMYYLLATVVQKDGEIMDWFIGNFGGMVYMKYKTRDLWIYQWRIENIKAAEFLKKILPFVRYKKPQIELALRFQERKNQGRKKEGEIKQKFTGLSENELQEREKMRLEMKRLKTIYTKSKNPNVREYQYKSMVQDERLSERTSKEDAIV